MDDAVNFVMLSVAIGTGATLVMDGWGQVQKRAYNVPPLNYAFVGRWLGYMVKGRFSHHPIAASPSLPGEKSVGWVAHYLIGIAFAAILLAIFGSEWAARPRLWPAMLVGLATMTVPFLVMQPAFGIGIAARRTPDPQAARLRSLLTHGVFGLGLYLSAVLLTLTS